MQRYFHQADVSVRRHRWTEVDEADQARADGAARPSRCPHWLGDVSESVCHWLLEPASCRNVDDSKRP